MKSVNVCVLSGWIRDIYHQTTNSGTACTNFTLEYKVGRKDDFGNYSDETHYRECVVFGSIAEATFPQMYNGACVTIQGDNYNVWTNNSEGKVIRRDKCRVFTINFHRGEADKTAMPEVQPPIDVGRGASLV